MFGTKHLLRVISVFVLLTLLAVGIPVARATTFSTLYSFTASPTDPSGSLIMDSSSNLYGVASGGGSSGCGMVFESSSTGTLTILHTFSSTDGCEPNGPLLRDSGGNLYGTASSGGANGYGVIFKIATGTNSYSVLHSFTSSEGHSPNGGLVFDSSSNLVGTTSGGGAASKGTIFSYNSSRNTLTTLWSFSNTLNDGQYPYAGVAIDSSGNLYGTTSAGCTNGYGSIYKFVPATGNSVLHAFASADGTDSTAAVIRDSSGTLYGTARSGGAHSDGTVFSLTSGGTFSVLHSFNNTDGEQPDAELYRDSSNNLYGTTFYGGSYGTGVVFEITSGGTFSDITSLGNAVGYYPNSGLVADGSGNLFTSTTQGPAYGLGSITKINSGGTPSVLAVMADTTGSGPTGIARDSSGNLILVTQFGGSGGAGTLAKLNSSNQLSVLNNFAVTDMAQAVGRPAIDSSGDFFGSAPYGAGFTDSECLVYGCGGIFEYSSSGHFSVLHQFGTGSVSNDGHIVFGSALVDSSGNLYDTTSLGGSNDFGIIFKITGSGTYSVLHTFTTTEGTQSHSGPIRDASGNLYGTSQYGGSGYGTLWKLDTSNTLTVLYHFSGSDGAGPAESLMLDSSGVLHGTTLAGGTNSSGTIFKYDTNNSTFSSVYSMSSSTDGSDPYGFLVRDSNGNLYGTTQFGGPHNCGTIWKLDSSNNFSVLHALTSSEGCTPYAGLVWDGSNLYGTTTGGGSGGGGIIFKVVP